MEPPNFESVLAMEERRRSECAPHEKTNCTALAFWGDFLILMAVSFLFWMIPRCFYDGVGDLIFLVLAAWRCKGKVKRNFWTICNVKLFQNAHERLSIWNVYM